MKRHEVTPPSPWPRPASALRGVIAEGYTPSMLRADLLAGAVVGLVALPLSMALAIASGVPPQYGLYTAIVAGGLIPLLGGSRFQVSGPTAAFVVILSPISHRFGIGGLALASLMAGLVLLAMGALRMGRFIEFVPHPVTAGFTAGIAVVIATLQVKDLLGLTVHEMPEQYVDRVGALAHALPTAHWPELALGVLTLGVLGAWPRVTHKIPGPLVALVLAAAAAAFAGWLVPSFSVATIGSRFEFPIPGGTGHGIPPWPPWPMFPWTLPGAGGEPLGLSFALLRELLPYAFAIAALGAIESLLSAVVADGMTGRRHDPDAELLAQGTGNLVAPFFGGFAATGAIARTATAVRFGARSPVAASFHAIVVLVAVVLLAPLLGFLPMASLAAVLLFVAWNMAELDHFAHVLRVAPRSDVAVLVTCFLLTVLFDMVVAVSVGVVMAALLFMRRMAEVADVRLADPHPLGLTRKLPPGVVVYEVAGPLFFGAARKAMSALQAVDDSVRVVILDLRSVPALDATGLVGLESAFERLHRAGALVVIGGAQPQPLRAMARAGWSDRKGRIVVHRSFERAVEEVRVAFE
jgi:SulP family sulfate permease